MDNNELFKLAVHVAAAELAQVAKSASNIKSVDTEKNYAAVIEKHFHLLNIARSRLVQ